MFEIAIQSILVFLASLALTRIVIFYLRKRAILDQPNHRSSHTVPTPRGGGIAVVAVILLFWLWNLGLDQDLVSYSPLLAGLGLAVISWLDDIFTLSAKLRLLVQIILVAATLPWLTQLQPIYPGYLPLWAENILITLIWVGFINFFNFMDGIDGISGVQTASIGLGLTLIVFLPHFSIAETEVNLPIMPAYLITALAAAGFLIWNWHPAKVFLGDVGSVTLGFLLGAWLLKLVVMGQEAAALILPGYYLADAGLTLLKRLFRKERIWEAHRDHYYQRAVRNGRSHAQVSLAIGVVNILLIGLAIWSLHQPLIALACAVAVVLLLLTWMNRKPQGQGAQA